MSSTLRKWAFGVLYSGFNCWILNAIFYAFSFVISRISGFSPLARKSQFDCSFIIIVQPLGLISVACQKEKGSIKKKKEKLEWYPETLDYLLIINNYYTIFLDSHLSFNFRIPKLLSSSNPSTRRNLDLFLFLKHRRISAEPRKLLNNLKSPESAKSVGGLNTLSSQKCNDPFINCLYSA